MTKLEKIEEQVQALSETELTQFREWFAEFEAAAWDRQIEEDIKAGKLDKLAEEASEAYRSGLCRPL